MTAPNNSVPAGWQKDVLTAWRCARENNGTIPDESLDLMRAVLLAYGAPAAPQAVPAQSSATDAEFLRLLRDVEMAHTSVGRFGADPDADRRDTRAALFAYVDGLGAQAVPVASEWISVDERLPELHTVVVLRNENTHMNVPFDAEVEWTGTGYLSNFGQNYWSVFGERGGVTMDTVTHWMPLPTPPAPGDAK